MGGIDFDGIADLIEASEPLFQLWLSLLALMLAGVVVQAALEWRRQRNDPVERLLRRRRRVWS